ncbi:MAG TPA: CoA pyrophosphatase [Longimicrobiaceae bacterium]|nr:CoA pyrophosphatase [Longimicrobiaceae bacterium]
MALVVRPQPHDLELLFIRRAVSPGDPWSGHMALPGGRRAPSDADGRATAQRETLEEVGIDLATSGEYLGRLDDLQPRSGAPAIVVSPYVFAVAPAASTRPNHEVEFAVWVALGELTAPHAAAEHLQALASGESLRFPAIAHGGQLIWGLTYRIVIQFLGIVTRGEPEGAQ